VVHQTDSLLYLCISICLRLLVVCVCGAGNGGCLYGNDTVSEGRGIGGGGGRGRGERASSNKTKVMSTCLLHDNHALAVWHCGKGTAIQRESQLTPFCFCFHLSLSVALSHSLFGGEKTAQNKDRNWHHCFVRASLLLLFFV